MYLFPPKKAPLSLITQSSFHISWKVKGLAVLLKASIILGPWFLEIIWNITVPFTAKSLQECFNNTAPGWSLSERSRHSLHVFFFFFYLLQHKKTTSHNKMSCHVGLKTGGSSLYADKDFRGEIQRMSTCVTLIHVKTCLFHWIATWFFAWRFFFF